ncbi:MAG: citrate (Si)-synthase [Saprospiraceae bacterium]|nr:MAG: citrate (Si)-synthase [Saprospiraceae bacterium]
MDTLKQKFFEKSTAVKKELKAFLAENGQQKIADVNISQVAGGARGITMLLWEPSLLDADEGIRFRGYSIPELREKLPKGDGDEPLPEGLFWLLLAGEIPTDKEVAWLSKEWNKRSVVPPQTFKVLDGLSPDTHPMTQFIIAITTMQVDSVFSQRYAEGLSKDDYWDAAYEDTMNLIARLPRVAAYIYRRSYHNGGHIAPSPNLDWAANLAHMLGNSKTEGFKKLMRLYLTIHADHEGGNASAHTTHLVGSTLSDPYLSFAAGMAALAGPLHGLANQEVIKWIFEMVEAIGTRKPTASQISAYVKQTLAEGKVVPGYGHAVLRKPDPRFIAQKQFAERNIKDDDFINVVWKVFEVVPPILEGLGKVKNPWPNVDAHSGAILVHYGLTEYSFYTVLFGVSRALGVLASLCWARALGLPLERPKSITLQALKKVVEERKAVPVN